MSSALFQEIVEATRGEYVLHATLGQSDAFGAGFLAREVASGRSVVLVVPPSAESLDVVGAVGDTIPADAGACAACGFRVSTWTDACPRCEHSLLPTPGPSPDAAALADELRGSIDVLGGLPHVRGGTMYFGREATDGRLAAFVVRPQGDDQLALDVVWEAAEAGARPAPVTATAQPAGHEPAGHAPADAWAVNGVGMRGGTLESGVAPVAEHEFAPVGAGPAVGSASDYAVDAAARPRRRLLPIGLGVGALALVGAAAFALTRGGKPVPSAVDTARVADGPPPLNNVPTAPTPPAGTSPNGTPAPVAAGATPPVTDSARAPRVLTPAQQAWLDSVNAVKRARRDSIRLARSGGTLTLDGDLPSGWTLSAAGATTNGRDVHLPAGQPVLVRISAPGYCADTLTVKVAPGAQQHWAPVLRGGSLVEQC